MNKYLFVGSKRQQQIVEYLQKEHYAKCKELAEHFGVSERSIRADINKLKKTFPIEVVQGRYNGGIYMNHGDYLVKEGVE